MLIDLQRLGGPDRFATAARVSAETFADGAEVAYVATGWDFADALAGGPVAARAAGPVLLATRDTLPAATAQELQRLRPARIVVLGGRAAISPEVETALRPLARRDVTRVAGTDRYGTAAALVSGSFSPGPAVVYVATGEGFADALSAGAAAARVGAPLLLTGRTSLPAATRTELERLDAQRVVVVGGPAAVDDVVLTELAGLSRQPVTRSSGPDRYATAAAIAATFPSASTVFLATGMAFPDALAGVPAAGAAGAPMLLVGGPAPTAAAEQVARLDPDRLVIVGGKAAVPDAAVDSLLRLLN
jgi:putative cell wall-binding protein